MPRARSRYNLRPRGKLNYSDEDYFTELFDDDDDACESPADIETSNSEYASSGDNTSDDDTSDEFDDEAWFSEDESVKGSLTDALFSVVSSLPISSH